MPTRTRSCGLLPILLLVLLACSPVFSQGKKKSAGDGMIKADEYSLDPSTGLWKGRGNVVIQWGGAMLRARKAWYNTKTKDFGAEGDQTTNMPVRLRQDGATWEGMTLSGNLKNRTYEVGKYRMTAKPFYVTADSSHANPKDGVVARGARLSTCEQLFEHRWLVPWQLWVSTLQMEPKEAGAKDHVFMAKHAVLQVYGIPVFYWPYVRMRRPPFYIKQGRKSSWGQWVYIGGTTEPRWTWIPGRVKINPQIEYRAKRGTALLLKSDVETNRLKSELMLHFMRDRERESDYIAPDGTHYNGRFEAEDSRRYRIREYLRYTPVDDLDIRAKFDLQSDNDMLLEFFRNEFQRMPEPPSYLDLSYLSDRMELSANYRPQVNEFNSVVERLPEFRMDFARQRLGSSMFCYQGETSVANLRMNFRDYDLVRTSLTDDNSNYATSRFDSAHIFYAPFSVGWLNLLPRAGARFTWYADSSRTPVTEAELNSNMLADDRRDSRLSNEPVSPYDDQGGSASRWVGEVGFEMNFKAYRDWPNFKSEMLDLEGLRHLVSPYLNYVYIPNPNEDKDHLYFFDEIDRIDEVNMVRVGLDQTLIAARGFGPERHMMTLLRLENYWDYYLDPETGLENAGDFGTILEFTPEDWLIADIRALHDTDDWRMNSMSSRIRFGAASKFNFTLGYRYRNDYRQRYNYSFGSDLRQVFGSKVFPMTFDEHESVSAAITVPLGENMWIRHGQSYDLLENELETRFFEFHRRQGCWSWSLGWRQNNEERSFQASIYLSAFPKTDEMRAGADFQDADVP